jgi:hypothetical protein
MVFHMLFVIHYPVPILQGSQTQIHRRATFQRQSTQRAVVYYKKLFRAAIYKNCPQNRLNLIKIYNFMAFWDVRGPHKCIWRV